MTTRSARLRTPRRLEVSTIGLRPGEISRFETVREQAEAAGYEFGLQPHHSNPPVVLNAIRESRFRVHSVHGPLLSRFAINLTSEDEKTRGAVEKTIQAARVLGADEIVFHGFFLSDKPVRLGSDFHALLAESAACDALDHKKDGELAFFNTRTYHLMKERVKVNFRRLRLNYPDFRFCLKNDFPAPGAGNRSPDQIAFMEAPSWIDAAHLWAAALRDGFDFYRGLEVLLETNHIRGIYLHTNQMPLNQRMGLMRSHGHLFAETEMSFPKILSMCRCHRVARFCLEIEDLAVEDIACFIEWNQIPQSGRLPKVS